MPDPLDYAKPPRRSPPVLPFVAVVAVLVWLVVVAVHHLNQLLARAFGP
jgi:hypothetical protein